MAHLRASEVRQLLHNKFVVIMGDSIQRAVYKDLVLLLQKDCLLSSRQLKAKGELSFEHDVLLEGGRRGRMHNGTHYREVRQFRSGHHLVRFYFLTRAYSQYVEDVLEQLRAGEHTPDVVVMNSCLWDLSRYGRDRDSYRDFRRSYCRDLGSLFGRLARALPESCLLVWNTTMPVAQTVSGGFLPPGRWPSCTRLREDVLEANFYSATEAGRHGFDVLDLHFHFRHAGQHRQRDGVHWDEWAHRHLSMLLLAHLAGAWGVDLPCRGPIRDGPAGRRPDPRGRRHPGDSRGDPTSSGSPPRLPCPRAPRQPYVPYSHSGPPFTPHRQDTYLPSNRSLQGQQFSSDTLARQIGYSNEANESQPGPIRTGSAQHQGRGSSPYPPRRPSRPHRHQRRHTSRRT